MIGLLHCIDSSEERRSNLLYSNVQSTISLKSLSNGISVIDNLSEDTDSSDSAQLHLLSEVKYVVVSLKVVLSDYLGPSSSEGLNSPVILLKRSSLYQVAPDSVRNNSSSLSPEFLLDKH